MGGRVSHFVIDAQHHVLCQNGWNHPQMKTIGERIRQAREDRQLSQTALAKLAGFATQSAIGNLEARATGQGGNRLSAIAIALDVPLDWLLNGPDAKVIPRASAAIKTPAEFALDARITTPSANRIKAEKILSSIREDFLPQAIEMLEFVQSKQDKLSAHKRPGNQVPGATKKAA